jgi:hypothetical protein
MYKYLKLTLDGSDVINAVNRASTENYIKIIEIDETA